MRYRLSTLLLLILAVGTSLAAWQQHRRAEALAVELEQTREKLIKSERAYDILYGNHFLSPEEAQKIAAESRKERLAAEQQAKQRPSSEPTHP